MIEGLDTTTTVPDERTEDPYAMAVVREVLCHRLFGSAFEEHVRVWYKPRRT